MLELASAKINAAAAGDGALVVPTSGGFDSRLIDVLLTDRRRIRAFSYGTSDDPARSVEVVKAAELARRLGLRWELVPLGAFHRYLDEWDALFGVSTHAHGMYQMEFYRRILERVPAGSTVLSGICGEWFAGDDQEVRRVDTLRGPDDLLEVFRFGRMCADSRQSQLESERLGLCRLLEEQPRMGREILPRVFAMGASESACSRTFSPSPPHSASAPRGHTSTSIWRCACSPCRRSSARSGAGSASSSPARASTLRRARSPATSATR